MLADSPMEPLRSTTATSSRAWPVTTARNPAAIESTATSTPTTPAIPKIATTETARPLPDGLQVVAGDRLALP